MLRKMFYFVKKYMFLFLLMAFFGLSINVSTITIADKVSLNSITFRPATDKDLFWSTELCFYIAFVFFAVITLAAVLIQIINNMSCAKFALVSGENVSFSKINNNNVRLKKDVFIQLRI